MPLIISCCDREREIIKVELHPAGIKTFKILTQRVTTLIKSFTLQKAMSEQKHKFTISKNKSSYMEKKKT